MARRKKKPLIESCEKVTSSFNKHYALKIAKICEEEGIVPAVAVRLATKTFLNIQTLDLVTSLQRLEDKIDGLRQDFEEAVIHDEE